MSTDPLPDEAFLIRPLTIAETEDALRRAVEAFGGPAPHGSVERWRARAEAGELWAAEVDGVVTAHCRITAADHWFLGQAVPCQRVASVSVAPEHRGLGAGGALMRAMVRKGYSDGLGLSVLFPATTAMYRGLGWEHAGDIERARLDTVRTPPIGPALRRLDEPDWEALRHCQQAFVRSTHGAGDRAEERWADLRESAQFVYALNEPAVEAYVLVRHTQEPGDWQYVLTIDDWAAVTPRGVEAVLGFVGRHGTLAKAATLPGPAVDLLGLHLPEQSWDESHRFSWMARGLDLVAAVGARAFPQDLAGEVEIEVLDTLLPEVRGPWSLAVADGKGHLEPASQADLALDGRAVGPLFTGFRSAGELALVGLISGPSDALARLGAMFASPRPRLLDHF